MSAPTFTFTHEQAFRPSAMRRCNACPGSYAMHLVYGDTLTTQGPMAVQGHALHNYLYKMIQTKNLHLSNAGFSDYDYKNTAHSAKKLLSFEPNTPWTIEQDLPVMIGANQVGSAHIDLMKAVKDEFGVVSVYIVDYKSMSGEHEDSSDSCQLRCYAIAAFEKYPNASKVCVAIEEPAVKRTRSLKFYEYLPDARHKLIRWLNSIHTRCRAAEESLDENGNPSEEFLNISTECKFCPVSSKCPLVEKNRQLSAELEDQIEVGREEYGRLYDLATAIIAQQTQKKNAIIEKVMADYVSEGIIIDGFNIRSRPRSTTVESTEGIVEALKPYMPLELVLSYCTVELAKLKKEFIEQIAEANGITKTEAGEQFDTLVYPYINKPDSVHEYASRSK